MGTGQSFTIGQPVNIYKQFVGCFVPNWLGIRQELKPGAKLVYARLAQFAGKDGRCYPSITTLKYECGVSRASAMRHIAELEAVKLIRGERKAGVATGYVFLGHKWMAIEAAAPVVNCNQSQIATGANLTPHPLQSDTGTGCNLIPKENHKENHKEKPAVGVDMWDFVKWCEVEFGGTAVPSNSQQSQITAMLESVGTDRLRQIASANETAMGKPNWGYRLAILQNHKDATPPKECPECGKRYDGCKDFRVWANCDNYKKITNPSLQIAKWVGIRHFRCPKCNHRDTLHDGEFEAIKKKRGERKGTGGVVAASSAMAGMLDPSPPQDTKGK